MAGLSASEKQMLKVLGVILVIMAAVWGRNYLKKSGSSSVRGQSRAPASSSRRTASRTGARGAPSSKARSKKQVLTPRDIPRLNDNLQLKLKQMKNPDSKTVNDDQILYETTNIFLPPEMNDRQAEMMKREKKAAEVGTEMMADTIFFRGVAHVNGERLAILERGDRTIPWYVKEGDMLDETGFVVTNIAKNDRQVTLLDKDAKRDRDKYRTIPWSGIESSEELSTEPPKQAPKTVPKVEVETGDDWGVGEDDLEIME